MWLLQSDMKRGMLCQILTQRVKVYATSTEGQTEEAKPEDKYADDVSILESYRSFLPPDMQHSLDNQKSYTQDEGHNSHDIGGDIGSSHPIDNGQASLNAAYEVSMKSPIPATQ
jgi:hypothetical protein